MELIGKNTLKVLVPFIVCFAFIIEFHNSVDLATDDYQWFYIFAKGYYEGDDVLSFLDWRYQSWTSRIFIEFFTFYFVQFPISTFIIVNSLILTAIVGMTYMLFSKNKGVIFAILAIIITFLYKITDQGSAGYLVTMIVYMWPLATFLPTLFPLKRNIEAGECEYGWKTYSGCALCALFCCNFEQIALAAFLIYGMFVVYTFWQNKKIDKLYYMLLLIAVAHLLFSFTCPGNVSRTAEEILRMPEFEQFSILKKIALCIGTPICKYMMTRSQSYTVWCFTIMLPLLTLIKQKKLSVHIIIASIPLILLGTTFVKEIEAFDLYISKSATDLAVMCVASALFYIAVFYTLIHLCKDKTTMIGKYGPAYILFTGLATRICLGMTTSYIETARTFFLIEYAMIAICILFLSSELGKWKLTPTNE